MEKLFCDFCKNEIKIGEACKIELQEPRENVNEIFVAYSSFDSCKSCFLKLRNYLGIKP